MWDSPNAGESRHFSLVPERFERPGRALRDSRLALLTLLVSALAVVSCATWVERGVAPSGEEAVSVPMPLPPPRPQRAEPAEPMDPLAARGLAIPVRFDAVELSDSFDDARGKRRHQAIDIMAPRGTPVVAVDDGTVAKVYRHPLGGLSVYQYDGDKRFAYYYAHLDRFAPGLKAGMALKRGDVLGYVGTSGNASPTAPHLHFAIYRLGPEKQWWRGTALNPYPYLQGK